MKPLVTSGVSNSILNSNFHSLSSKKNFAKKLSGYVLLTIFILIVLPGQTWSQQKQLTASNKVVKIAYLDHSRLRKEYTAYTEAMKKFSQEYTAGKLLLDQALQLLNQQTSEQLKLDSLNGAKNQQQIINNAADKRLQLTTAFQARQQKNSYERVRTENHFSY